jgi:hypothetical protein
MRHEKRYRELEEKEGKKNQAYVCGTRPIY